MVKQVVEVIFEGSMYLSIETSHMPKNICVSIKDQCVGDILDRSFYM